MKRYIVRTNNRSLPLQANDLLEARFNACIELYDKVPKMVRTNPHSGWSQGYDHDDKAIGDRYCVVQS